MIKKKKKRKRTCLLHRVTQHITYYILLYHLVFRGAIVSRAFIYPRFFFSFFAGSSGVIHIYKKILVISRLRYVEAKADRVTVVFSTIFKDPDDVIIGKVFMQEFKEGKRGSQTGEWWIKEGVLIRTGRQWCSYCYLSPVLLFSLPLLFLHDVVLYIFLYCVFFSSCVFTLLSLFIVLYISCSSSFCLWFEVFPLSQFVRFFLVSFFFPSLVLLPVVFRSPSSPSSISGSSLVLSP